MRTPKIGDTIYCPDPISGQKLPAIVLQVEPELLTLVLHWALATAGIPVPSFFIASNPRSWHWPEQEAQAATPDETAGMTGKEMQADYIRHLQARAIEAEKERDELCYEKEHQKPVFLKELDDLRSEVSGLRRDLEAAENQRDVMDRRFVDASYALNACKERASEMAKEIERLKAELDKQPETVRAIVCEVNRLRDKLKAIKETIG